MKKVFENIGVFTVTTAEFFVVALVLNYALDYLYWETSYIDWILDSDQIGWIAIAVAFWIGSITSMLMKNECVETK